MTKEIILTTLPHTGTHALIYLFDVLGGVKVHWCHFAEGSEGALDWVQAQSNHEYVFVRTYRSTASLKASHDIREARKYHDSCLEVYNKYDEQVPYDFRFPIEDDANIKTGYALEIFYACGVGVSYEALRYMKTWHKLAGYDKSNTDTRGFDSAEAYVATRAALKAGNILRNYT